MSYYQIEDIVAECVYAVDESSKTDNEKRELFEDLYLFQALFDTNITSEREDIAVILKKYHFTEDENNSKKVNVVKLVRSILEIYVQNEEFTFAKRWYATFVNSIFNEDLGEFAGISEDFDLWLQDDDLMNLRIFLLENRKIFKAKHYWSDDELYILPKLKNELSVADTTSERSIIRFLLDEKSSITDIQKQGKKDEEKAVKNGNKIPMIADFFKKKLGEEWRFEQHVNKEHKLRIDNLFCSPQTIIKNNQTFNYTLLAQYDALGDGLLCLEIWITCEEQQKFVKKGNLLNYAPLEEVENKSDIAAIMSSWYYNTKHTEKTLQKRLNSAWHFYEKYHQKAVDTLISIYLKEQEEIEKARPKNVPKEATLMSDETWILETEEEKKEWYKTGQLSEHVTKTESKTWSDEGVLILHKIFRKPETKEWIPEGAFYDYTSWHLDGELQETGTQYNYDNIGTQIFYRHPNEKDDEKFHFAQGWTFSKGEYKVVFEWGKPGKLLFISSYDKSGTLIDETILD